MSQVITYEEIQSKYILLTPGKYPARTGPRFQQLITSHKDLDLLDLALPYIFKSEILAIDFETVGADYSSGTIEIVGLALAWATGSLYIDWSLLDLTQQEELLDRIAQHPGLIAHNVNFDGGVLYYNSSLDRPATFHTCTYALLAYLANESPEISWSLKACMTELLGWPTSNTEELDRWLINNDHYKSISKTPKERFWKYVSWKQETESRWVAADHSKMHLAPPEILGKYSVLDAEACYLLYTEILRPAAEKFPGVTDCHADVLHIINILIRQKTQGLPVDRPGLAARIEYLQKYIAELDQKFISHPEVAAGIRIMHEEKRAELLEEHNKKNITKYKKNGEISKVYLKWEARRAELQDPKHDVWGLNIQSHIQLADLLYNKLGMEVHIRTDPEDPTSPPAVSIRALSKMGELGEILVERAYALKELGYLEYYMEQSARDGKLHPSFRAPGTVTGRMSSKEPNLQQCFHPDVEILTKQRGWVKILDVTTEDLVWQVTPNSDGKLIGSWTYPSQVTNREYIGPMLSIYSDRISTRITADHRMLTVGASNQPKLVQELTAAEMLASDKRYYLRTCTESLFHNKNYNTELAIWKACLVQADGSSSRQLNLDIWRFGFNKQRKIDWMIKHFGEPNKIAENGVRQWYALDIKSPYLNVLSKSLNFDQLEDGYGDIVTKAIAFWDGHDRGTDVVWQSNCLESIDSVQRYLVRNGYQAKYWNRVTDGKVRHVLTIKKNPRIENRPIHRIEEQYTGRVGCLSVPSGYVLTRYEGQSLVIGQCPKTKDVMKLLHAPAGKVWVDIDFSALEPMVTTEASQDPSMLLLYGPDAKKNDLYLFVAAQIDSLSGPILACGYDPYNPTDETVARAKKECKRQRSLAKIVCLAAAYGAGVRKIMQILEEDNIFLSYEEVEEIHSGYWEIFARVRDFGRSLEYEWKRQGGYILNGFGRPMAIPHDYRKDMLNRFVQSTGHDILLRYVHILTDLLDARGIDWQPNIIDFHDSTSVEVAPEDAEIVVELMHEAMYHTNEQLGCTVKFRGDPEIGRNLAETKQPES